jgi:hypothetical protein
VSGGARFFAVMGWAGGAVILPKVFVVCDWERILLCSTFCGSVVMSEGISGPPLDDDALFSKSASYFFLRFVFFLFPFLDSGWLIYAIKSSSFIL